MGRLAGFRYREIARRLRAFGYTPSGRQHGSHEIWISIEAGRTVVVPRHAGDMPEGTLRAILRQADIAVEAFLAD